MFYFESQDKRYKYNSLPQRWASSASAFHFRMCNILVDTKAVVYVDDVLVKGKYKKDHDANLGEVPKRVHHVGMHIGKKKTQLGTKHVLFLGYDVYEGSFRLASCIAV